MRSRLISPPVPVVLVMVVLALGAAGAERPATPASHAPTPDRDGDLLMLYAPSEDDNPSFRAALSDACGLTVHYFDARSDTPSVELLSTYDCVFTWTNFAYADRFQFGDNLMAYVDEGGKLIMGQWSNWGFGGGSGAASPIVFAEYCPVWVPSYSASGGTYAGDGSLCIHGGVEDYYASYRDECILQGEGQQDGSFTDGALAVAYRPDFRVIYSPGNMGMTYGSTGDWAELTCNMCSCPDRGDFDADGDVDLDDYAYWDDCMTGPDMGPYALQCALLDFEPDGDVDLADFAGFQEALGGE